MMAENEYWMSRIMRENPALYELLRDFGYTKEDWDELDPAEKDDLKSTALSCYCINHGIASVEAADGQERNVPAIPKAQVVSCKLW